MSIHPHDLLLYAGGRALEKYGTFVRRTWPADRGGEDVVEQVTRGTPGTYVDRDRNVRSAAAGALRHTWIERNGVLRPYTLLEAARAQVAANPQTPASWTDVGTPVITTTQTDPWGTGVALLVQDDDGVGVEGKFTDCTFVGDGEKFALVAVADGTIAAIQARIRDVTTGEDRHMVRITFQSGSSPTVTTDSGAGTIYPVMEVRDTDGRRWWLVGFEAQNVVAANTNRLEVFGTSTNTGTFYLAGGNAYDFGRPASWFGSVATRNADQPVTDFPWAPQAMSAYVRFIELAEPNWVNVGGIAPRLLHLGADNGGDGTLPRLLLLKTASAGTYEIGHSTSAGGVFSSIDLSSAYGDDIELFAQLYSDGAVQLHGRKNGGSITSGTKSAALALPAAWSAEELHIGSLGANGSGDIGLDFLAALRGADHDDLASVFAELAA